MNKVFAVVFRHNDTIALRRCCTYDADAAEISVITSANVPKSAVIEVYRWFENITEIRQAVNESGQNWFNKATLRLFGTSILARNLYAGRYFVTSESFPDDEQRFSVRKVVEDKNNSFSIDTVYGFRRFSTRNQALAAARKTAYQF